MVNFDDVVKESIKEHDPNWEQILDDRDKIFVSGGFGSGKRNLLFI